MNDKKLINRMNYKIQHKENFDKTDVKTKKIPIRTKNETPEKTIDVKPIEFGYETPIDYTITVSNNDMNNTDFYSYGKTSNVREESNFTLLFEDKNLPKECEITSFKIKNNKISFHIESVNRTIQYFKEFKYNSYINSKLELMSYDENGEILNKVFLGDKFIVTNARFYYCEDNGYEMKVELTKTK